MKPIHYVGIALFAVVCIGIGYTGRVVHTVPTYSTVVTPEASSSMDSSPSSSEEISVSAKTVTIVDKTFTPDIISGTGSDWLKAIGVVRLEGQIGSAKLHIKLDSGWSAIGAYIAGVSTSENGNKYPDESIAGKHLHFIDAVWSGKRTLSAESNIGVLKEHATELTYDLSAVPFTSGDDGTDTSSTPKDLAGMIANGGLYIGFAPSGYKGHITVTLEYTGDVSVTTY